MAMANDVSSAILAELKEHVRSATPELWYKGTNDALLALLETAKEEDGFGRGHVLRVVTSEGSSSGGTFGDAQDISEDGAEGSSHMADRFVTQPVRLNAVLTIKAGDLDAARSKGADEELDYLARYTDAGMAQLRRKVGIFAAGDGTGALATLTAVSTTTATISTSFINRIKAGDRLMAYTSGGSAVDSANPRRVTGVNPATGVITFSTDVAAAGWAATNLIYFKGTKGNAEGTTFTGNVPSGVFSWVPTTAPGSSDSFYSVNRFGKPELGGYRFDATNYDSSGALIAAATQLFTFDQDPDLVLVSPKTWEILTADKDATKIVSTTLGKYEIGFDSIKLHGAGRKSIEVVPSNFIPQGQALMGEFKGRKEVRPVITVARDLVNIDDAGGYMLRMKDGTDDYEMRMYFRGQIEFPAPGCFSVITNLPTS